MYHIFSSLSSLTHFLTFLFIAVCYIIACDDLGETNINLQEIVSEGQTAEYKRKDNLPEMTKSFSNYMLKDTLKDFAATALQVSDTPYDLDAVSNIPTVQYEFPNGYNQAFGSERFRIPEGLFDPSVIKVSNLLYCPLMICVKHAIVAPSMEMN